MSINNNSYSLCKTFKRRYKKVWWLKDWSPDLTINRVIEITEKIAKPWRIWVVEQFRDDLRKGAIRE